MSIKRLFQDPNIWVGIGIAIAVTIAFVFLIIRGCNPEDEGLLERDGHVLHPDDWIQVWNVVADDSVDPQVLSDSIQWINDTMGEKVVIGGIDPDRYNYDMMEGVSNNVKAGNIYVAVNELRDHIDGGVTSHIYDKSNGEVWYSEVTIAKAHVYDRRTYVGAMKHELCHAVLMLADDPDGLNSIMQAHLNPEGTITDHDKLLALGIIRETPDGGS